MPLSDHQQRSALDVLSGLESGGAVPIRSPGIYRHLVDTVPAIKIDQVTTRGDRFIVWVRLDAKGRTREKALSNYKEAIK